MRPEKGRQMGLLACQVTRRVWWLIAFFVVGLHRVAICDGEYTWREQIENGVDIYSRDRDLLGAKKLARRDRRTDPHLAKV
jgi:hypothetical protein